MKKEKKFLIGFLILAVIFLGIALYFNKRIKDTVPSPKIYDRPEIQEYNKVFPCDLDCKG